MKALDDRAKYRLRLAATFLREQGMSFPSNGDFYGQVLVALQQHPERLHFKELVDWVEEYDPNDELGAVKGTESAGRRKGRGTLPLSKA